MTDEPNAEAVEIPTALSMEEARRLMTWMECTPGGANVIAVAVALDTARAEQREQDEEIALRYTGESYVAELIANAIRQPGRRDVSGDDIVAELDRWLLRWGRLQTMQPEADLMRCARDEIVALRKGVASGGWVWEQIEMMHKAARAEALEEAAQVVEDEFPPDASEECADRIRALKDKR
jgi:hypothetical protein